MIDLEKHNWPWTVAIVPVLKPDLIELANNHHWRIEFGVRNWAVPAPKWMRLAERGLGNGSGVDTELAWTHYGFETYYALLNCGFRLRPSAGTANGVHPVPLGFSRVYVHCDGGFSYEKWMKGYAEGKSFVTTGPMVMATANGQQAGAEFKSKTPLEITFDIEAGFVATEPNQAMMIVQVIHNGSVVASKNAGFVEGRGDTSLKWVQVNVPAKESGWFALRTVDLCSGRFFAHTAPWWVEIEGKPLHRVLADRYSGGKLVDKVFCYVGGGWYTPGQTFKDVQDEMRRHLDDGYTMVKMKVQTSTFSMLRSF